MTVLGPLAPLRAHAGARLTEGLDDASVERLAASHPVLREAIQAAADEFQRVAGEFAELLDLDEAAQIQTLQSGFVNFYADDCVTPYVALAARGPWVITLKGAVLYDAGGYGMLIGPCASREELARFRELLKARPDNYIAQPTLAQSQPVEVLGHGQQPVGTVAQLDDSLDALKRLDFSEDELARIDAHQA